MGAADSFDGSPLGDDRADAVAKGDDSSQTGGRGSRRSESVNTAAECKSDDFLTSPSPASGEPSVNPYAAAKSIVQVKPLPATGSFPQCEDSTGANVGRTPSACPADDPSDLTTDHKRPLASPKRPIPVIHGYEVLGELGRGGMGIVYRAREVRLNRLCAFKMILAGADTDVQSALRFRAEGEAVAKLQHPNVVQIHHIGEADGLPFFELEFVDGGSLDSRLDGIPWPARQAAALVEALARGVSEAHRLGIVHRYLKPGNIFLSTDGTPKITDFDLAKSLATDSGLTRSDSIMGSPAYMAPEQPEGRAKQVGPLADIYALGVILYELLTGRPPFRGATVLETLEQVRTTEPVPPSRLVPGLPRDVETVALKCLQKESGKRYPSAAALADDLHRFLAGEPIVARPIQFWERGVKWARRRPAIATLAAAVSVLFMSLLASGRGPTPKSTEG
jgi:eukaryotic-like serine/threonine-protein kinase